MENVDVSLMTPEQMKLRIHRLEADLAWIRGQAQVGEAFPTAANFRRIVLRCHNAIHGHVLKTRCRSLVKNRQSRATGDPND